jgi:hypothetical protein
VAAWIFVWRLMPELTGRSLEQIEAQLHSGRFKPADFDKAPAGPTGEGAPSPPDQRAQPRLLVATGRTSTRGRRARRR